MKELDEKIYEAYIKSIIGSRLDESVGDFIGDSKIADAVFKDLRIAANDILIKTIIPKVKKIDDEIKKKYKLSQNANMFVKNFGTADLYSILYELLGQQFSTSGKTKYIYMSRT